MWNSSDSCSALSLQASIHSNCEYTPPEKKVKEDEVHSALMEALECCKNQELGIEEASAIYGVSKQSLRSKLRNHNFSTIDDEFRVFVLPVFPAQAELDLVRQLNTLLASQVKLTPVEVRRLAYEIVSEKYMVDSLPQEKNCLLGQRWCNSFMTKYPHLSGNHLLVRSNEGVSESFYDALKTLVSSNGLDSNRIYAVDCVDLKFRASSSDDLILLQKRKTLYTDRKAICCTNPTGCYVPPMFLKSTGCSSCEKERLSKCRKSDLLKSDNLKSKTYFNNRSHKNGLTSEDLASIQKKIKLHLSKQQEPMSEGNEEELREKLYERFTQLRNKMVSKYKSSPNEVTNEVFYEWLQTFVNFVKPNPNRKVLLVISHANHVKYFKTLDLMEKNGILFLALPPHSSHKIYPLDGFAMSLNRNLSTCARRWLAKNPNFNAHQVPLQSLFNKGYSETINPVIAKNGFLYSGIWPINQNVFRSTELGGESVLLQDVNSSFLGFDACFNTPTRNYSQGIESFASIAHESDLQKLCRVCLKEKMYMKPLFEGSSPNYHGKKISDLINMPILPTDGLPGFLCQYCLVEMMDAVKVKTLVINSYGKQIKLKEAMQVAFYEDEENSKEWFSSHFRNDDLDQKFIKKILLKNFDMNSVCRICMVEKSLMTPIFYRAEDGTAFPTEICTKIMEVTRFQVHLPDDLSSSICSFCRAFINKAHEFVQKVLNSNKRFREIIMKIKAKKEIG